MSNASTIPYRTSLSVLVVYEDDGMPLYCGRDVAEVLGYKAPIKAAQRIEGVTIYRRIVPWCSEKDCRRHSSKMLFLDRHGCEKMAELRKAGNRDAARWVTTVMFEKAELGCPPATDAEAPKPAEPGPVPEGGPVPDPTAPVSAPVEHGHVADVCGCESNLDAIIAQYVMMKAQIGHLYGAQYAGQLNERMV